MEEGPQIRFPRLASNIDEASANTYKHVGNSALRDNSGHVGSANDSGLFCINSKLHWNYSHIQYNGFYPGLFG